MDRHHHQPTIHEPVKAQPHLRSILKRSKHFQQQLTLVEEASQSSSTYTKVKDNTTSTNLKVKSPNSGVSISYDAMKPFKFRFGHRTSQMLSGQVRLLHPRSVQLIQQAKVNNGLLVSGTECQSALPNYPIYQLVYLMEMEKLNYLKRKQAQVQTNTAALKDAQHNKQVK